MNGFVIIKMKWRYDLGSLRLQKYIHVKQLKTDTVKFWFIALHTVMIKTTLQKILGTLKIKCSNFSRSLRVCHGLGYQQIHFHQF